MWEGSWYKDLDPGSGYPYKKDWPELFVTLQKYLIITP